MSIDTNIPEKIEKAYSQKKTKSVTKTKMIFSKSLNLMTR